MMIDRENAIVSSDVAEGNGRDRNDRYATRTEVRSGNRANSSNGAPLQQAGFTIIKTRRNKKC
jgi:hypothetical protein